MDQCAVWGVFFGWRSGGLFIKGWWMMMDLWDFFRALMGFILWDFGEFFSDVFFLFGGRPNLDDYISSKRGLVFHNDAGRILFTRSCWWSHEQWTKARWLSRENGGSKTTQLCGECSIHHYKDPYLKNLYFMESKAIGSDSTRNFWWIIVSCPSEIRAE